MLILLGWCSYVYMHWLLVVTNIDEQLQICICHIGVSNLPTLTIDKAIKIWSIVITNIANWLNKFVYYLHILLSSQKQIHVWKTLFYWFSNPKMALLTVITACISINVKLWHNYCKYIQKQSQPDTYTSFVWQILYTKLADEFALIVRHSVPGTVLRGFLETTQLFLTLINI